MSAEENKALARRFYDEVFNKKNLGALDELLAPDLVDHALPPGMPSGPTGVRQSLAMYIAAFPDLQATIEDLVAEGDKVVARVTYRGTHQGGLMAVPPTGRPVTVTGIDISRVAEGKFVEHWGHIDMLGLLQQLGVIPTPGQS